MLFFIFNSMNANLPCQCYVLPLSNIIRLVRCFVDAKYIRDIFPYFPFIGVVVNICIVWFHAWQITTP